MQLSNNGRSWHVEISLIIRRRLYPYSASLFNSFIMHSFLTEAERCPSLRVLEQGVIIKVADSRIAVNNMIRRSVIVYIFAYVAFIIGLAKVGGTHSQTADEIYAISGILVLNAIIQWLRLRIQRSSAEQEATLQLFSAVTLLERDAALWPESKFRWQVAKHLEEVSRRVEKIPLASPSLAPSIKNEAFRLSAAKAQAIRNLELWAIRPMELTYTDLVYQLTCDLVLMAEGKWFELPEADGFVIRRSKLVPALQITGATALIGAAIALIVFLPKAEAAASIGALILVSAAMPLLNSAGISTTLINQSLQAGSKVISGK
jgi:hypothetical protein